MRPFAGGFRVLHQRVFLGRRRASGQKKEFCMRITEWFAPRMGHVLAAVAFVSSIAVFPGDGTTAALSAMVSTPGAALETGNRKGTVWVVNRDQGTLMVFDADSGEPLIPKAKFVGRGAHDICISEQSGKAYITAETDNVVSALDVEEVLNAVTAADVDALIVENIPVAPLPHHIEPSHDGRLVYVTLFSHTTTPGNPQYAVIDTSDHSVTYTTTSANPNARAHAVFPTRDGD